MDNTLLDAEKRKQASQDLLLLTAQIYVWRKERPNNDELKALSMCVVDLGEYIKSLENENRILKKMYDGNA